MTKIKKRNFFSYTVFLSVVSSLLFLSSCGEKEEPAVREVKKTVLLYAVASNNLYGNLIDDKQEMLDAAEKMNLDGLSMLVYEVTPSGNPVLSEIVKNSSGKCDFKELKSYDRELYSTDPKRISSVINDMLALRAADSYGIIFWSHGTGIDPSFSTHTSTTRGDMYPVDVPSCFSFGSDKDSDKDPRYSDEIDIDELADAIPDGIFDFIWFDACYMSGIETMYELRDKCDYFVGYPTEVFTPGMPYDLTLPYILQEKSDLEGGARAFFDYYAQNSSSSYRVATIAVVDMKKIESVADVCRSAYQEAPVVSSSGLQTYTRGKIGPFYDFGQYTKRKMQAADDKGIRDEFDAAMSDFVIWKAATETDFNYRPIAPDNFSGISCYRFDPSSTSKKDEYYKTLDWYNRVY